MRSLAEAAEVPGARAGRRTGARAGAFVLVVVVALSLLPAVATAAEQGGEVGAPVEPPGGTAEEASPPHEETPVPETPVEPLGGTAEEASPPQEETPVPVAPVEAPTAAPSPAEPVGPPAPGPSTEGEARTKPMGRVVAETFTAFSREAEFTDGLVRVQVFAEPTFVREPQSEEWERIDTALEVAADDPSALVPAAAAEGSVEVERRLSGRTLRVGVSETNTVTVEHLGAAPVSAVVEGDTAVYPGAFGGGRDLEVTATATGFEDAMVIDAAAGGGSWRTEFGLPAGATVEQGERGVALVGAEGEPLGSYGDGVAFDAAGRVAPVAVTLVGQRGGAAVVEVGVDPAWLDAPGRVFPVTVDPTYSNQTLYMYGSGSDSCEAAGQTGSYGSCDTYTYTDGPSYAGSTALRAGRSSTGREYQSFVKFATDGWGDAGYKVTSASLRLTAYSCCTSNSATLSVYRNTSSPTSTFAWSGRPGRGSYVTGRSVTGSGNQYFDVRSAVQAWLDGQANHGLQVVQTSTTADTYRSFYSSESSGTGPSLTFTYTRPDTPLLSSPSDGARSDAAPTLKARWYDPGGRADGYLMFYVTGTTRAGQSWSRKTGWLQATYNGEYLSWNPNSDGSDMPPGSYRWFVYAHDGRSGSPGGCGYEQWSCPRSFTVNRLPYRPSLVGPASGATTTDRTPTLSVRYSDPDGDPGGVDMRLFNAAGTQLAPTPRWFSGDGSSGRTVSFTAGTLAPGSYSWDVRAWDGRHHSDPDYHSPRYTFTVANRAPYKPALVGPADGAATCDTTPALSTRYSDPDGDSGGVDLRLFNAAGTQIAPTPRWWSGTGANGRTVTYTSGVLAPGRYTWDVRAWDGRDYSDVDFHSPRWSVVVQDRPGAPRSATFTPQGGSIRVGWAAPSSDGGSAVSGYTARLYAGTAATGTPVQTKPVAATARSVDFTGLSNTTTYTSTVVATNACGTGGTLTGGPGKADKAPAAPTLTTATPGDGQVALAWSAPTANGGSPVTSYRIRRYTGTSASGTAVVYTDSDGDHRFTVTGLTNGQAYTFTVTAVNAAGEGPQSGARTATPRGVPDAPALTAADPGDGRVTLTWSPPADEGGSPVTGYTVRVWEGDSTSGTELPSQETGTGTSHTVDGLTNGQAYTFTLAARNAAGSSPPSNERTATPYGAPGAPTLAAANPGNGEVDLAWTEPDANGEAVDGYVVRVWQGSSADGAPWRTVAVDDPSATGTTVAGLTNGQAYAFTVAARNAAGHGGQSNPLTAVPYGNPAAPTLNSATPDDQRVTLAWTTPTGDGAAVDGYVVRVWRGTSTTGEPAFTQPVKGGSTTGTTVTSLTNGQAYTFTVAATSLAVEGPQSNSKTAVPYGRPFPPSLTAANPGDQRATLTWTVPNNNGRAIEGYTVRVWQGTAASGAPARTIPVGAATSATVDGLTNGQAYTFTVAAKNLAGEGAQSSARTATPYGKPSAPDLTAANPGDQRATLTWTVPNNNGRAIDGYTVRVWQGTAASGAPARTIPVGAATSATVDGLTNGQAYTFTIAAKNLAGEGAQSSARTATPYDRPFPPNLNSADPGDQQVALAWDAADANGEAVDDHLVRVWEGDSPTGEPSRTLLTGGAGTSFTVTGLANGQTYAFTVAATNAAGEGPQSNARSATPSAPPGAPGDVRASAGDGSAVVAWSPSASSGAPVTAYDVETHLDADGSLVRTDTVSDSPAEIAGLSNGTTYYFVVTARSDAGDGPPSAESNRVTPTATGSSGPSLRLMQPTEPLRVRWATTGISGRSEPGARVRVYADRDGDGTGDPSELVEEQRLSDEQFVFEALVTLDEGDNRYLLTAEKDGSTSGTVQVPLIERFVVRTVEGQPDMVEADTVNVMAAPGTDLPAAVSPLLADGSVTAVDAVFPGTADPTLAMWYALTVRESERDRLLRELPLYEGVLIAEPSPIYELEQATSDPLLDEQRFLPQISAFEAWNSGADGIGNDGNPVAIGIIDSLFDVGHPDLPILDAGFDVEEARVAECAGQTTHGTSVAGLAAAATDNRAGGAGVGRGARVIPVQAAVGENCERISGQWVDALPRLVDMGAEVVNMSFGNMREQTRLEQDVIRSATNRGALVVTSAGNDYLNARANQDMMTEHFPSGVPLAVSVAAVDADNQPAAYTNTAPFVTVDLAAPGGPTTTTTPVPPEPGERFDSYTAEGDNLVVTTRDRRFDTRPGGQDTCQDQQLVGNNDYCTFSGTSAAAPIVSGAAALVTAQLDGPGGLRVARRLFDAARDIGPGFGNGLLNAAAAVTDDAVRLGGPTRIETAEAITQEAFPVAAGADAVIADEVVLVPADGPDEAAWRRSLPAAGLLAEPGTAIVLSHAGGFNENGAPEDDRRPLHPAAESEVQRLFNLPAGAPNRDEAVVTLVGDASVSFSQRVEDLLQGRFDVDRVAGMLPPDTDPAVREREQIAADAVALADRIQGQRNGDTAVLVTQEGFADALSMSAVAADRGYPMLFVERDLIPEATCRWFSGHPEVNLVHVAGGDAAVASDLPDRLRADCGEADLAFERHAGADRVRTSLVIARRFFDAPAHAALATGGDWPDAVLGGNLASAYSAPVLLSFDDPDGDLGPAVEAYLREDMSSAGEALVLGGVAALTDEFEAAVEGVLQ